jgi:hypothetical protein
MPSRHSPRHNTFTGRADRWDNAALLRRRDGLSAALRRAPFVPVMQAAHLRNRDDGSVDVRADRSR